LLATAALLAATALLATAALRASAALLTATTRRTRRICGRPACSTAASLRSAACAA
jgi:hypothetical protein